MSAGPTRTYPCSDCRLLFMDQLVSYLLSRRANEIHRIDPALTRSVLKELVDDARDDDLGLTPWNPGGQVSYPNADAEADRVTRLNKLWAFIERVRAVVQELPVTSSMAAADKIWSQLERPGEYVLDSSDVQIADQVQFVQYADIRHQLPSRAFFQGMERIPKFPDLRLLSLYANALRDQEVDGPAMSALPLKGLDMSSNELTRLPIRQSRSLRWLNLSSNRLQERPDLSGLPALRWLDLSDTPLNSTDVEALRKQWPGVTIFCGS